MRQRLADKLEVPAWESLVIVMGCVSCSLDEGDVGGLWPSGDGEVKMSSVRVERELHHQGFYKADS